MVSEKKRQKMAEKARHPRGGRPDSEIVHLVLPASGDTACGYNLSAIGFRASFELEKVTCWECQLLAPSSARATST